MWAIGLTTRSRLSFPTPRSGLQKRNWSPRIKRTEQDLPTLIQYLRIPNRWWFLLKSRHIEKFHRRESGIACVQPPLATTRLLLVHRVARSSQIVFRKSWRTLVQSSAHVLVAQSGQ